MVKWEILRAGIFFRLDGKPDCDCAKNRISEPSRRAAQHFLRDYNDT